jgi:methyl-accepting chemotaxis protein
LLAAFDDSRVATRARVVAVAALLVAVSSLSLAGVLGQRASSVVHEAQVTQRTQLAAAAREAATLVVDQVDAVRAEAQLVAHDARLDAVAIAGADATPAQQAAARVPMQFLVGVHPVQVSLARIRTADGFEVLRVLDAETTRQGVSATTAMERGDGGSPWVEKALQSTTSQVFTSAPHGLALLDTDVVTTVVPLGPDRPVGTFEVETPVSWIVQNASTPVTLQGDFQLLRPEQATTLLGDQTSQSWAGMADVGDATYAWNRVTFDDRAASLVGVDWLVVASETAVTFGLSDLPLPVLLLGVLGVLALVVAVVAAFLAARGIRRSRRDALAANRRLQARLADMSAALGRVAAGDLAAALPVTEFEDDALRGMAGSFDSTLGRLRGLVGQAQEHGLSLAHAAVELRAAAAQQATAATEQSSVVTETTATIEELAATAAQIAQTAEQVASLAGETLRLTEAGRESVNSAVEAMDAVATRVETIGERAVGLGETGREIARILAVIDDLSERTNLLALNAAIEAARAGEHGQGFAVVAGEVRRLAERARASTTQIQALVSRIGAESGATVVASEEGRREVDRAQGVAHEAAAALERIAGMVDDTTLATREISIATQQQRSASDQVVVAMGQVSDATRQYAVGSRQAAASAQELAALAETMQSTIGTFSTDADADAESEGQLQPA